MTFPWHRFLVSTSVILLALALAPLPPAQTQADQVRRWSDLNARVAGLYKEGKYSQAESVANEAVQFAEAAFGSKHPAMATPLNNLAMIYAIEGKYAVAELLWRRSLTIYEQTLGPEHPAVATSLNNLAALYYTEGKYAEAEPLYRRGLAIMEKMLGPTHPDVAMSLNNLAELYCTQGKYADAEPLIRRSLAIREKALGSEHPAVATSLNNLAVLYYTEGKYAEAEPLIRRSLAIREKTLGPEHPDVAASLSNLAWLQYTQGKHAEAESLYRRSLTIVEKELGSQHPHVADAQNNLALLYYTQGRYTEAEVLLRRSLAIREKALGPEHPDVAQSLNSLALLHRTQGRYMEAEPLYDRSFENLSHQFEYHFTYMSEKERLEFLATVADRFPAYFSFCITYKDQDPTLAGKMFDMLLWEKGFIAQSVAALRTRIAASGDPQALALLEQLRSKQSQQSKLLTSPVQDPAARRKQVEALEQETNELERELVKRSTSFAEEKRLARATWREVQKTLKSGEAAVEMVLFRFHDGKKWTDKRYYVALIVTPETSVAPALIVVGEGQDLEGPLLNDYRKNVEVRSPPGASNPAFASAVTSSFDAPSARKAYAAIWKPLEPALKHADRIYLSPDGALNQISWAVLADTDGRLLAEKYDLRLVSNTRDLLRQKLAAPATTATLIGNPAYSLDEAQQQAAVRSIGTVAGAKTEMASLQMPSGMRSRDQEGGQLASLPGTAAEVKSVADLLRTHGWQVATYTEASALEEAVKRVQHPRVLHLATHGFFLRDQKIEHRDIPGSEQASGLEDPMLRSGLFFAGANRTLEGHPPADVDNGILTAYESTSLNLHGTELVVLSACETGLGKVEAGEGVFGLRRAFQVAGAEAVLMSLWSVPDRETQELMTLFYEKWLAGKDKHQALREAQLEEREVVKKRYGRDLPFYWGAFILVGR